MYIYLYQSVSSSYYRDDVITLAITLIYSCTYIILTLSQTCWAQIYKRNNGILTLLQASASLSKLCVFMGKCGFLYKSHEMRRFGHESAHLKQGKKELTANVERVAYAAVPALTWIWSARLGVLDTHSSETHANMWFLYYICVWKRHLTLSSLNQS